MISQHTANDCPRLPPARQQGPAPVCNFPSPSAIMTVMPNKFIFFFNTSSRLQIKSALHPHPISLSDNDGWWPSPFIASTCISLPICLTTQIHRQLYSVPLFLLLLLKLWLYFLFQFSNRLPYSLHPACIQPSTILCALPTFPCSFSLSLWLVLAVSLGLGSLFIATLIPLLPESSLRSGRLKRGRYDRGVTQEWWYQKDEWAYSTHDGCTKECVGVLLFLA